jgi:glucose/arabinose dehydrogenase
MDRRHGRNTRDDRLRSASFEERVEVVRLETSAEEPQREGQKQAEQQPRAQGQVEGEAGTANHDIAREPAQAELFRPKHQPQADESDQQAHREQGASEPFHGLDRQTAANGGQGSVRISRSSREPGGRLPRPPSSERSHTWARAGTQATEPRRSVNPGRMRCASPLAFVFTFFAASACQSATPGGAEASRSDSVGAALPESYAPPFFDRDPTVAGAANASEVEEHPKLRELRLPPGFEIRMYAQVPNARSLELAPDGTLFVGNRQGGSVYAVRDADRDGVGEWVRTVASGMRMPNGVAFHEGDLYVAEISRVWRFAKILDSLPNIPSKELVNDDFPSDRHHGWKYIAFGPDGLLYVPVGAPCNICKTDYDEYSNIMRMKPNGSGLETFVKGVRNSVGFDWHPQTGELWFSDNGRDRLGDNVPPDELNRVTEAGQHFGYPYCHGGVVPDPKYGDEKDCAEFVAPAKNLGPHVAALGLEFYEGDMFPAEYRHQIFLAEHGSWNRSEKIGYRVMLVRLDDAQQVTSYEVFAKGWLQGESAWGRPVDVEFMSDGSMLLSDDQMGAVYRIVYTGSD